MERTNTMETAKVRDPIGAGGWTWPLWGAAAGLLGGVGHLFTAPNLSDEEYASGAGVIDALDRTSFHIGVVAGMLAVFCLLVFAAGWRRWAAAAATTSLAAGVVTLALVASAGAMILGYGMKGSLAVYLPGGIDEGSFPAEGLYATFMFIDLGPFMAWWGVAMAAAAVGWLSLREHVLPLWIGVLSALFVLIPLGVLIATGLPGFPGVVDPLWLIITSVDLAVMLRRSAPARALQPAFNG
jgi:hypothetical protein